ncbi:MAG: hypothetical protein QOD72_2345 [Acidimicrobiaceae bacterium]|jgi:hypothetical protein|nr:hypothetical protein [Acidimicrobiaceae bacterium]
MRVVSARIDGVSDEALKARVERAAETAPAEQGWVATIDVLQRLGWLPALRVDEWRQGRLPCLERGVEASLGKVSAAVGLLRRWARARGLVASETAYLARTRDRRPLRFSVSENPDICEADSAQLMPLRTCSIARDRGGSDQNVSGDDCGCTGLTGALTVACVDAVRRLTSSRSFRWGLRPR